MKINDHRTFYSALNELDLFENCCSNNNFPFNVKKLFDWKHAEQYYCDPVWEDVTLEASNELSEYISVIDKALFKEWNCNMSKAKDIYNSKVKNSVELYQQQYNLNAIFIDCIEWDITHILFLDFLQNNLNSNFPVFFTHLRIVYELGHYPCGWEGSYPNGTLIVI